MHTYNRLILLQIKEDLLDDFFVAVWLVAMFVSFVLFTFLFFLLFGFLVLQSAAKYFVGDEIDLVFEYQVILIFLLLCICMYVCMYVCMYA